MKRTDRVWDKSDRQCLYCEEWYTPVRYVQKYCPPPKRCRNTNFARRSRLNLVDYPLKCRDCEEDFVPRASNQVTCGADCPGKKPLEKVCAYAFCSQEFIVTRTFSPNRQKYCSEACCTREFVYQKYSMSSHDFVAMVEAQGGNCLACGEPPTETNELVVDHDHSCCGGGTSCGKCVRGLLHRKCNMVEGMFKDNPADLLALANYMLAQQ